jgi:hypothetical protein
MNNVACLDSSTQESARHESVSEGVSETIAPCSTRTLLRPNAQTQGLVSSLCCVTRGWHAWTARGKQSTASAVVLLTSPLSASFTATLEPVSKASVSQYNGCGDVLAAQRCRRPLPGHRQRALHSTQQLRTQQQPRSSQSCGHFVIQSTLHAQTLPRCLPCLPCLHNDCLLALVATPSPPGYTAGPQSTTAAASMTQKRTQHARPSAGLYLPSPRHPRQLHPQPQTAQSTSQQ